MAGGPLASEPTRKRLSDKVVGYQQTITDDKTSAIAWQYEPTKGWPAIVYMSPRGVVVSKTFKFASDDELGTHMDELAAKGKELDAKLAELEAACEKDAKDVNALDALAGFWVSHGNWGEALPVLEKLIKMTENGELAKEKRFPRWIELARARAITHGYEDAIKECEAIGEAGKAAKFVQASQAAYLLEGFCREQQGDTKAAEEAYGKALALGADSKFGKQAQASIDRLKRTSSAEGDDR